VAPQIGEAIKRSRAWSTCSTDQRNTISGPATLFRVDQAMARAPGSRAGARARRQAIMQGEPAATPLVARAVIYDPRQVPGVDAQLRGCDQEHAAGELDRAHRHLGTLAAVEDIPGQTEVRRENCCAWSR